MFYFEITEYVFITTRHTWLNIHNNQPSTFLKYVQLILTVNTNTITIPTEQSSEVTLQSAYCVVHNTRLRKKRKKCQPIKGSTSTKGSCSIQNKCRQRKCAKRKEHMHYNVEKASSPGRAGQKGCFVVYVEK